MRVGVACFYHETNVFALEQNDRLDAICKTGSELYARQLPMELSVAGLLDGLSVTGVDLVPTVGVHFVHNGLIRAHVFEHYRDLIVKGLVEAAPFDAICFVLHGASVVEAPYMDAEGELLAAARAAVGDVPFVATYDFHAVMTEREVGLLTAAFTYDTNPHIDVYDRGREAAACLLRMLRGELRPVTRLARVPILGPNIGQSTWSFREDEQERLPLYRLRKRCEEMERRPGVINVSVLGGYGYADTPDTSMSVLVTTDHDPGLAGRLARELAAEVWSMRRDILEVRPIFEVDEGVRRALTTHSERPVVLVDLGDDPGSSCPADSPVVLESLLRQGARDTALVLRDAHAVAAAHEVGVGGTISMEVGATIDRRFYRPLRITGTVKSLDDGVYRICGPHHGGWGPDVTRERFIEKNYGPRAVVRVGNGNDVIFVGRSDGHTGKDRDFFKSAGILLEEKRVLVVKSNQAHRASFDPVVAGNIDLNTPGISTVDYGKLPFRYIPRPLWPIDTDFDWAP